jgi:hypothetical protein
MDITPTDGDIGTSISGPEAARLPERCSLDNIDLRFPLKYDLVHRKYLIIID